MSKVHPNNSSGKASSFVQKSQENLLKIDRFPTPISLNFNKISSIPTLPGFIISLALYLTVLAYAIKRG